MQKIVDLLWKREESALDLLKQEYSGLCQKILTDLLSSSEDAEEALNDVWFEIWNSIPPAKPRYFKAYLAKTVRNTALHHIAYQNAQKRSGISVLLDELAECIPDPQVGDLCDRIHLKDTLNAFVRSLDKKERSIFLCRYFFGESISEIALRINNTENTVAVTLFRTRQKLRSYLNQEGINI